MSAVEPTVFIVDDDSAIRKSVKWLVESVARRAETFDSAQAFLDAYTPDRPGCILTDVSMPGMGGPTMKFTVSAARNIGNP